MFEKQVPYDVDAEEAVLGSILIDPEEATAKCMGLVEPGDFYRDKNGWIYDACLTLYMGGKAINQVTVAHELQRIERLEAIGGVSYLSKMVAQVPTSVHAGDYAEIVKKCSINRRLIHAAQVMTVLAYENGDPAENVGKAQEALLQVSGLLGGKGLRSLREIAQAHQNEIREWVENPQRAIGVPTGFTDLDATIGGFEPGKLYVLAARTSMGKSQVGTAFAVNVARQAKPVAIFTPEMSELQILLRVVLAKAKVNRYAVRIGQESDGWERRFWDAMGEMAELPIWVDDTSAITTSTTRSRAAVLKAQQPNLGLLVFDYANLAGDDPGKEEYKRITDITRRLQAMAKSLEVPVLALYQLNRAAEARDSKRPLLSDLRQSGVIEECADVVMMLYRPAYYKEMGDKTITLGPNEENLLEVWVRKQRDGAIGVVKLHFNVKTGAIGNWGDPGRHRE